MPKKGEYTRFKNYERKTKSLIDVDFESILVSKDNGKRNLQYTQTTIKNMLFVVMTRN